MIKSALDKPTSIHTATNMSSLASILEQVHHALDAVANALHRFSKAQECAMAEGRLGTDYTHLTVAVQNMHQVVAALNITENKSCAVFAHAMELAIERCLVQHECCSAELITSLEKASYALVEYLTAVSSGNTFSPVLLFPHYEAVLKQMQAQKFHPADLYQLRTPLNLSSVELSESPADLDNASQAQLDQTILSIIHTNQVPTMSDITLVCLRIAAAQTDLPHKTLWILAAGFFDAIAQHRLNLDIYGKRTASALMQEYTAITKGKEALSENLLQALAFYCSQADKDSDQPLSFVDKVRHGLGLSDDKYFVDYNTQQFDLFNPNLKASAHKLIANFFEDWSALAGDDLTRLKTIGHQFDEMALALRTIYPQQETLLHKIGEVVKACTDQQIPPETALALEIATAVLYLESSHDESLLEKEDSTERLADLLQRINIVQVTGEPIPVESWTKDLYRRHSDKQIKGSVVDELKTLLTEVENSLDAYFRGTQSDFPTAELNHKLDTIAGIVAMLGLDQAGATILALKGSISTLTQENNMHASQDVAKQLTHNVNTLQFLISMLSYQRSFARDLFYFDQASGLLYFKEKKHSTNGLDIITSAQPDSENNISPYTNKSQNEEAFGENLALQPRSEPFSNSVDHFDEVLPSFSLEVIGNTAQEPSSEKTSADKDKFQLLADIASPPLFEFSTEQTISHVPSVKTEYLNSTLPDATTGALDEMLETFIEEARSVFNEFSNQWQVLHEDPSDETLCTSLRRAFYTLKDSSRMVGLDEFSDAAWAFEQLLNEKIANKYPLSSDLIDLCAGALHELSQWIEAIANQYPIAYSAASFRSSAEAMLLYNQKQIITPDKPIAISDLNIESDILNGIPSNDTASRSQDVAAFTSLMTDDDFVHTSMDPELLPTINADSIHQKEFEEVSNSISSWNLDMMQVLGDSQIKIAPDQTSPANQITVEQNPSLQNDEVTSISIFKSERESIQHLSDLETLRTLEMLGDPMHLDASLTNQVPVDIDFDQPLSFLDLPIQEAQDTPTGPAPTSHVPPSYKEVGGLRISINLYNVYIEEADGLSQELQSQIHAWAHSSALNIPPNMTHLAHSLAGNSAKVGFESLHDLAKALELALQKGETDAYLKPYIDIVLDAADEIRLLLHQFAAGSIKQASIVTLQNLYDLLSKGYVDYLGNGELHTLEQSADADNANPASAPPEATFIQLLPIKEQSIVDHHEMVIIDGNATLIEPASEEIMTRVEVNPFCNQSLGILEISKDILDGLDSFKSELTLEDTSTQTDNRNDRQKAETSPTDQAAKAMPPVVPNFEDDPKSNTPSALAYLAATHFDDIDLDNHLDPDLLSVFEEESGELVPSLSMALRSWIQTPTTSEHRLQALRILHTLKGSARLVGAMKLAEMTRRLEGVLERLSGAIFTSEELEPVLSLFDSLYGAWCELKVDDASPPQHKVANESQAITPATIVPISEATPPSPTSSNGDRPSQSIRVNTMLLDQLLNMTGEVMISQERLDSRLHQIRFSLGELSNSLESLREQVRDVEVQAEAQMRSRMTQQRDTRMEFDPLEPDQFMRIQELTRFIAESINDVGTIERTISRAVDGAEDDVVTQDRQIKDIQGNLLRTRMMELESISDQLHHVVRQASKESGKQVNLEISGAIGLEIDRTILDRLAPSLKHLLRNAVVHGIENSEVRQLVGKPTRGCITLFAKQEGVDISISISDDGAGLTTAENVTELAGRGIGMDAVRSEILSLGGRIEVNSIIGQGCTFKIVLPLTTAILQITMLSFGSLSVGIPSNLLEDVLHIPPEEITLAYQQGELTYNAEKVPLYWSGALLQNISRNNTFNDASQVVVIFKSAGQRVAVHVDEVMGNREVVLKPLGAQLSKVPGLIGASVLPSGGIALIYNPLALAKIYDEAAIKTQ